MRNFPQETIFRFHELCHLPHTRLEIADNLAEGGDGAETVGGRGVGRDNIGGGGEGGGGVDD